MCLGLQGMVEHFGGKLGVLGYPMHGKPSEIGLTRDGLLDTRYVQPRARASSLVGTFLS